MSFGRWEDEAERSFPPFSSGGLPTLPAHPEREMTMAKNLDVMSEIIRNPKHPFRAADNRPAKPDKHRYERRKVKEIIKLGDWSEQRVTL
jgi:hypothetical protein